MGEFRMPQLGASMEAGTIAQWLKQPGDAVAKGDIIAVVDTEKGAIEVEVFESGIVREIRVPAGTKVPVGTVLATIAAPGAPVEPAAPSQPIQPTVPPGSAEPQEALRRAIAAAMTRSKREIPHFYLAASIDLHRASAWLAAENARRPVTERLLMVALFVKATARAAADVPVMNGFWRDDRFVPGGGVHPGIAVSLKGGGLVTPALHDADRLDVSATMAALHDLVARARAGGLRGSEMTDQTMTITSLGDQGVETSFGIVYPPQVALVSFGRVLDRPVAVDGSVVVHPVVSVSVSVDHRAVDGHRAGLFLAAIDRGLQAPEAL